MPTITDTTVVAQAYDTSGNGGRKLVRLSDGSLIATLRNGTTSRFLYKSTDNGNTWSLINSNTNAVSDSALSTNGTEVYRLDAFSTGVRFSRFSNTGSPIQTFDFPAETTVGNVSLAINEAKTELHAAWTSKNSTYPNSFNIRYTKGTINGDGSVTWGAVEQVTSNNTTSYYNQNPSVIIGSNGYPIIISEADSSSNYQIHSHKFDGSTWSGKVIYNGGSYIQSSPSAIYVPQSINGLANGRIWVAWHGTDATDTAVNNIRVSYSDDGGVTWSTMNKLSSGNLNNMTHASITANKLNEIFVVYTNNAGLALNRSKYSNGTWSNLVSLLPNNTPKFPSTLFDNSFSVNFTEPLLIYQGTTGSLKVGLYGTWTVTTISVTPGDIGQRTDKNNILSYSITTDGEMSTITEKINGTVVNTRNTTSGQAVTLGLTQAQWDAIRFGKYADATGGKNTLTVEMGTDKWTYTFDKRLATDADIVSASKAVKDTNEVYLPSVKKQLADAINAKGGSVSANADWLTMIGGLETSNSTRTLSGTVTSSSTTSSYITANGTSTTSNTIQVTGIPFNPRFVFAWNSSSNIYPVLYRNGGLFYFGGLAVVTYGNNNYRSDNTSNINGFILPCGASSTVYNWVAFE